MRLIVEVFAHSTVGSCWDFSIIPIKAEIMQRGVHANNRCFGAYKACLRGNLEYNRRTRQLEFVGDEICGGGCSTCPVISSRFGRNS